MNRLEWSVRETNLENEVAGGDLELIYTNGNIYIYIDYHGRNCLEKEEFLDHREALGTLVTNYTRFCKTVMALRNLTEECRSRD